MFDPRSVDTFRFVSCAFDDSTGEARFEYAFDEQIIFVETLTFPLPKNGIQNIEAFRRALFMVSLVAGVSYYKAAVPPVAVIESGEVTQAELDTLSAIYRNGLGEFAFINRLKLGDVPEFKAEVIATRGLEPAAVDEEYPPPPVGPLVAVGGGKDSCVSIEALRNGDAPVTLASINELRPIMEVIKASGLPSLHVKRELSAELFRINQEGAFNGHVPVTAVVSLTLVALALMHGHEAVVMSNERSASAGNTEWDGMTVNHQWSKSLEAETLLAELIAESIDPDISYFSLLRPLGELEIVRRFAKMTRYHDVFTSCNRAFRIDETKRVQRWCCNCPKCRFVFLAMAPFMNPTRLASIFGAEMLRDVNQAEGFDELIGWNAMKPFECVGEVEESVAAFMLLTQQIQWRDHELVRRFEETILPEIVLPSDLTTKPFVVGLEHRIPSEYLELLNATA